MDFHQIEAFVRVAHARHFTRAATALNRSQPAVTRRIALLERDLGVRLFQRVRGEVLLTSQGKALLPHAEAILASVREAREAMCQTITPKDRTVNLAMVGTLLNSDLAKRIRNFRFGSKRADVQLRTGTSQEVSRLVAQGEATLGIWSCARPAKQRARRVTQPNVDVASGQADRDLHSHRSSPATLDRAE